MFRTSLPARIMLSAVAFALVAGGIISLVGAGSAWVVLAICFAVSIATVGGVFAVKTNAWSAFALAVLLPVALLPYTVLASLIQTYHRQYGWAQLILGIAVTAMVIDASIGRTPPKPIGGPLTH